MVNICVIDLETSVGNTEHGATFRDPKNDFYTIITTSPTYNNIEHRAEGFKNDIPANTVAYKMISEADVLIAHNAPFDFGHIWHTKVFQDFIKRGGQVYDTQVGQYLLSGQRHSFASLAELQLIYLGQKIKESRISSLFKAGYGADKIIQAKDRCPRVFKLFDKYSADDGLTTLEVFKRQYALIKEKGMEHIVRLYNNYMLALIATMTTGIEIDLDTTERILQAFKLKSIKYLKESEAIVSKYWNDERLPAFNVKSPTHKSALLFGGDIKVQVRVHNGYTKAGKEKTKLETQYVHVKGFGLPKDLTNKSAVEGRWQTGKDVIDRIHDTTSNPEIRSYCELQKKSMNIEKMCSTYLEPFIKLSSNGKLYPYYNNTATKTGRLSSKLPNFQNIISKGGMEKYIKRPLIAPQGYKCVSIDFSQLEIYILALCSGDQSLKHDLLTGIDFHVLRLSYAEDMEYDEVYKLCKVDKLPDWDLKRSKAKIISYQKAYGASPNKLAQTTGLDVEIIKKIFEKEDINYPYVKMFNDHVMETINKNKSLSLAKHIPSYLKGFTKGAKRFKGGVELLPVMVDKLNADYYDELTRYVGYYKSITGKLYAFEEVANYDRHGKIRRGFAPTQTKNYPQQGGAADVVAMATYEVFRYSLGVNGAVKLCNQIHDSLEFYIKEDELNLHIKEICAIMQNMPKWFKKHLNVDTDLVFKVDVKVGDNFAEMREYKIG